jgi:hypothetical protein
MIQPGRGACVGRHLFFNGKGLQRPLSAVARTDKWSGPSSGHRTVHRQQLSSGQGCQAARTVRNARARTCRRAAPIALLSRPETGRKEPAGNGARPPRAGRGPEKAIAPCPRCLLAALRTRKRSFERANWRSRAIKDGRFPSLGSGIQAPLPAGARCTITGGAISAPPSSALGRVGPADITGPAPQ